ncbi:hypothetical protein CYY_000930 [Polysphondylium violaceum]|uniref:GRIP domain-containing protein n=1 Tax=Polysphondylium violaceum TaxID=133409 RepID=A0A8J4V543_9MYCE|nr:hypothetical protein CYY_000930 [Polysphondylium violaceum]
MSSSATTNTSGGGGGTSVNVDNASREELIEFIKKQAAHVKKLEAKYQEVIEAYKKLKKEYIETQKRQQQIEEESTLQKKTSTSIIQSLQQQITELNIRSQKMSNQLEEQLMTRFQKEKAMYQEELSSKSLLINQLQQSQKTLSIERDNLGIQLESILSNNNSSDSKLNDLNIQLNDLKDVNKKLIIERDQLLLEKEQHSNSDSNNNSDNSNQQIDNSKIDELNLEIDRLKELNKQLVENSHNSNNDNRQDDISKGNLKFLEGLPLEKQIDYILGINDQDQSKCSSPNLTSANSGGDPLLVDVVQQQDGESTSTSMTPMSHTTSTVKKIKNYIDQLEKEEQAGKNVLETLKVETESFYEKFLEEKENTSLFLNKQKQELEDMVIDFRNEIEQLKTSYHLKEEEIVSLSNQHQDTIANMKQESDRLRADLDQLKSFINEKEIETQQLKQQLNTQLEQSTKNDETQLNSTKDYQGKITKLKGLLVGAQKHISEQKKLVQDKSNEIVELNNQINDLSTEINTLKDQLKSTDSLQSLNETLAQDYEDMKSNYDYNSQRIRSLEDQLTLKSNEFRSLQDEYNEYKVKAYYTINKNKQSPIINQDDGYNSNNNNNDNDDDNQQEKDENINNNNSQENNSDDSNNRNSTKELMEEQRNNFDIEINQLKEQITLLNDDKLKMEREMTKLKDELEETRDNINIYKSKIKNLNQTISTLKTDLENNNNRNNENDNNSEKLLENNNNNNNTNNNDNNINNSDNNNSNDKEKEKEIEALKENYEKEIKLQEEKYIELNSQLNLFKRNNNSLMREKDRIIQEHKNTIEKLEKEILENSNDNKTTTTTTTTNTATPIDNQQHQHENQNLKKSSASILSPLNIENNDSSDDDNYNNSNNNGDDLLPSPMAKNLGLPDELLNQQHKSNFTLEHLIPQSILPKEKHSLIPVPKNNPLEVENILQNYAHTQASRDEELRRYQNEINQLKYALNESDKMEQKHFDQEKLLKEEIRNLERNIKLENLQPTYLKNIILRFIETDDADSLMPVLTTMLSLTPDEVRKANDALKSRKGAMQGFWKGKLF